METNVKPILNKSRSVVVLHCCTNDLKNENKIDEIGKKVINLAKSVKSNHNCNMLVSGIAAKPDNANKNV